MVYPIGLQLLSWQVVRAELPSDDEMPKRSDFSPGTDGDLKYTAAMEQFKELRRLVEETMLHRECGVNFPDAPCMKCR